jgi:soluble lytic murein transglycosylase
VEKYYGEDLLQALYVLQMRLSVKNREYAKSVEFAEKIYTASRLLPSPTLSDYYRGYFFSYTADSDLKKILTANIKSSKDPQCLFLSNFYRGRLAVREKDYETAMDFFKVAMDFAPTGDNYDNALWYYFDTAQRISFDHVLAALYSYGKRINDKEYFEDFFTSLSLSLLNKKQWNSYVKVFTTIAELPLGEIISQYAYVSARLLEEDYAKNPTPALSLRKVIENAYLTAYNAAKGGQYYRVLAAKKLAMPIESVIGSKNVQSSVPDEGNADFENLLEGYAKYGFAKRVFPEFIKDYYSVSLKSATKLSKLLYQKGGEDALLYAHSLRILSYASGREGMLISKDVLMGLYPRPFLAEVQEMAKKYGISEYILFGLVRTESFFQSNVHSHAGAIGLSQLMPSTAKDVAKALKLTRYNLYDPRTNLNFGAYYLGELIRRLDGSQLLALFSYNGGITRVRGWVKQNPNMPLDLLLEVVPILETRDYGRKVLSASVIYGYLYYGVNYNKIVDEIMSKR